MKMKHIVSLFVVLTATVVLASEAGSNQFNKGDLELGFSGSYSDYSIDGESLDITSIDLEASYFLMDNLSIGVNTAWFMFTIDGLEATAIGLEANARYHFQINQNFIPYVGIDVGNFYINLDDETENIATYGAHLGFKTPINKNVYFDTQLKWTDYDLPENIELTSTQILLGLKIKF